ncbi:hypothetical protein BGW80DRAFT_1319859 [Lactifluus volemus]|nr:hypothetical protein BGW80DRAFT_1319859 [Lactifluus volemus]
MTTTRIAGSMNKTPGKYRLDPTHRSTSHNLCSSGAKELIKEFWARHGKKKGERVGRKSDPKPKPPPRRGVAASVESSTPEPASAATKKRGRGRQKPKVDSDDDGVEEEEDSRSRKKGRKSNGTTRKSPSPASSSDRASEGIQPFEPSLIKKWNALPSWENHLEEIDTVERTPDGDLLIYFKLLNSKICAERFPQALIRFYEAHLKWKQTEAEQESD